MKTATTRPLENRRPKSFPSQLLFVLRLQIFKNKGLRNCCRKIKCFNYSAVEPWFQLRYLVFRKVTACSADGRKLKIKLYIFYLPLYENIRRKSGVFSLRRDADGNRLYHLPSYMHCPRSGSGWGFARFPGVPPPGAGRLNQKFALAKIICKKNY